mgnify:CR=1 FL=1
MLAFVGHGDYHILLDYNTEIETLHLSPVEGDLLFEGEVPTGKKFRIRVDHTISISEWARHTLTPVGWDKCEVVEIVLCLDAYFKLRFDGGIYVCNSLGEHVIKDETCITVPTGKQFIDRHDDRPVVLEEIKAAESLAQ